MSHETRIIESWWVQLRRFCMSKSLTSYSASSSRDMQSVSSNRTESEASEKKISKLAPPITRLDAFEIMEKLSHPRKTRHKARKFVRKLWLLQYDDDDYEAISQLRQGLQFVADLSMLLTEPAKALVIAIVIASLPAAEGFTSSSSCPPCAPLPSSTPTCTQTSCIPTITVSFPWYTTEMFERSFPTPFAELPPGCTCPA